MHTFYDKARSGAHTAFAAAGSLIITVALMATAIVPAHPSTPYVTGVLA
jgi:hypothetical protein